MCLCDTACAQHAQGPGFRPQPTHTFNTHEHMHLDTMMQVPYTRAEKEKQFGLSSSLFIYVFLFVVKARESGFLQAGSLDGTIQWQNGLQREVGMVQSWLLHAVRCQVSYQFSSYTAWSGPWDSSHRTAWDTAVWEEWLCIPSSTWSVNCTTTSLTLLFYMGVNWSTTSLTLLHGCELV